MNFKTLPDDKLHKKINELGLDPSGPRSTLIDRLVRYHKQNSTAADTLRKPKRYKKKKAKAESTSFADEDVPMQDVEVTLVPEEAPNLTEFQSIFEHFTQNSQRRVIKEQPAVEVYEGSSSSSEEYEEKIKSRKKLRKMNRVSISALKATTKRVEVVEWTDVTAHDPILLVALKSYRNYIPVPPHWSQNRKYLQGKRGTEKLPFELPGT